MAKLSIGAVTRQAGVAHGTFYVHFATKDALLDQLLGDFNASLAAQLQPIKSSPQLGLGRSAQASLELCGREPGRGR